jgi:hypothetical protein
MRERVLSMRQRHLVPLFVGVPIVLNEECTLMELQKAVMNGLQGESVAMAMRTIVPGWKVYIYENI